MSPRIIFEQELELLKNQVGHMGLRAENGYERLMEATVRWDTRTLEQLLDNDRQMVDMQRSIEAKCLTLLTRQQPVARDMRLVSASLKVVTDMERAGDHVGDIAELYLRMRPDSQNAYAKLLNAMLAETGSMLHESVAAFVEGDVQAAERVIGQDDVVDDYFNRIKESLMDAIRRQTLDADHVVDYLMIAKYLEKVGDHAVNIARWACFRITGDMDGVRMY